MGAVLVAAGSTLLVLNADGNVTAYVVGGVLLILTLHIIVGAPARWRQATHPRSR